MAEEAETLEDALLSARGCDDTVKSILERRLLSHKVPELRALSKKLSVRLTGVGRKKDIVERIVCMSHLGVLCKTTSDSDGEDETGDIQLTYVTDNVREKLKCLPKFADVQTWSKTIRGMLKDFTFMNLLVYLVCGRDKTFDMQSMRAYKSWKAYKYFHDGFVKNVWLHDCKTTDPRVVYARGFVHHSLTMDHPLDVFVALDGDSGHVFSAQCNCVSG